MNWFLYRFTTKLSTCGKQPHNSRRLRREAYLSWLKLKWNRSNHMNFELAPGSIFLVSSLCKASLIHSYKSLKIVVHVCDLWWLVCHSEMLLTTVNGSGSISPHLSNSQGSYSWKIKYTWNYWIIIFKSIKTI